MTKIELVKSVMNKTGVTQDVAEKTIAALQSSKIKAFKKK
jgi:hypothetical protein